MLLREVPLITNIARIDWFKWSPVSYLTVWHEGHPSVCSPLTQLQQQIFLYFLILYICISFFIYLFLILLISLFLSFFLYFFISSFLQFFISSNLHFFISAFLHFCISIFLYFFFSLFSWFLHLFIYPLCQTPLYIDKQNRSKCVTKWCIT